MRKTNRIMIFYFVFILAVGLSVGAVQAEPIVLDGLIEPSLVVNIGSSVPGVLESVNVERGDFVEKEQVVAALQAGVERANLALARYRSQTTASIELKKKRLDYARREKERFEELYKKQALPYSQMDEVETNMAMAESELQEALENQRLAELDLQRSIAVVERMTIRSTVSGVVVERFMAPGEYVEDKPIVKVARIDPLYVEVIASVEMLGAVQVGMHAEVRPEHPVGNAYPAKVIIVDQVIDAASGTFGVRLELPNPDHRIPAGLKCKVVFPQE